jgi:hypothetical protein
MQRRHAHPRHVVVWRTRPATIPGREALDVIAESGAAANNLRVRKIDNRLTNIGTKHHRNFLIELLR